VDKKVDDGGDERQKSMQKLCHLLLQELEARWKA
jgi:hypothetical protein